MRMEPALTHLGRRVPPPAAGKLRPRAGLEEGSYDEVDDVGVATGCSSQTIGTKAANAVTLSISACP